ncbi:MAG: choice-of-anchor Q domain-containing protein, partial [Flavobacteriales bacterium]
GRFTIRVEEPELPVVPGVVYVDHEATGNNDGSSWENAFTDLQDGIALVGTNESIWIAEGTYHPSSTNDPSERFLIPDASNVHGGFAGNEFLLDQREYGNNKTVLSAEIGDPNDQTDNSTYLIALSNGNIGIALDRVTISDVGPSSDRVLEIYNDNALVTDVELVNNNDEGNTVIARGEDTRMINCLIHNCGNGGTGGIIYSGLESHTELINCTITNNSKANGVYKEANGTFLIFNSIIQGNTIWGSFTTSGVEVYNSLIQVSQDFVLVDCIVNEDAQFVDSNNNDYNLTSGSPAVGLGDNSNSTHPYDYIGNLRTQNTNVDAGCYESPFVRYGCSIVDGTNYDPFYEVEDNSLCEDIPVCLGDFDGNGIVDSSDLLTFLGGMGNDYGCAYCGVDLDGDGAAGSADLLTFLANFGNNC